MNRSYLFRKGADWVGKTIEPYTETNSEFAVNYYIASVYIENCNTEN